MIKLSLRLSEQVGGLHDVQPIFDIVGILLDLVYQRLKLANVVVALGDEIEHSEGAPVVPAGTGPNAPPQLFQMVLQQEILK